MDIGQNVYICRFVGTLFFDGQNVYILLTKMSKGLRDIEDELAADELGMCSGAVFTEKQVYTFAAFYVLT